MFGYAWCLVMAQIQFSLIKNKHWMFRTLTTPPPPKTSDNISFLPYPRTPPPTRVDVICVSPLKKVEFPGVFKKNLSEISMDFGF